MIYIDHCAWDRPGADPFRGDPAVAVLSYVELPAADRLILSEKMRAYRFDDVAEIRRDTVLGLSEYVDLEHMHFAGSVCRQVSRASWTDDMVERGLVYCAGASCVIVPTVCNNLSIVYRLPPRPTVMKGPPPVPTPALPPVEEAVPPLPPVTTTSPPGSFESNAYSPPVYGPPSSRAIGFPYPVPNQPPPVAVPEPATRVAVPEPATRVGVLLGLLVLALRRFKGW